MTRAGLNALLDTEMACYRDARRDGDCAAAWRALERSHIISQLMLAPHMRVHAAMLGYAVHLRDEREVVGQIVRLALVPLGSLTGRIPWGNTGRSDVSAFQPMRVPEDLLGDRDRGQAVMARSLTGAIRSATGLSVQRILTFLIGLALLASLALGTVAHANEPICSPGVEAPVSAGHVDGDADQVPADSGKGYPHHHGGCHGHHVATPLDRAAQGLRLSTTDEHVGGTMIETATAPADPALRPPIA